MKAAQAYRLAREGQVTTCLYDHNPARHGGLCMTHHLVKVKREAQVKAQAQVKA